MIYKIGLTLILLCVVTFCGAAIIAAPFPAFLLFFAIAIGCALLIHLIWTTDIFD